MSFPLTFTLKFTGVCMKEMCDNKAGFWYQTCHSMTLTFMQVHLAKMRKGEVMVQTKNLRNSYIIWATEQSGGAVQCTLARGCTRYYSSLKIKQFCFPSIYEICSKWGIVLWPSKGPQCTFSRPEQVGPAQPHFSHWGAGTCFGTLCQGEISRLCF